MQKSQTAGAVLRAGDWGKALTSQVTVSLTGSVSHLGKQCSSLGCSSVQNPGCGQGGDPHFQAPYR